jgi:hypothetical protein
MKAPGGRTFTRHLALKGDVKVVLGLETQQLLHVGLELLHTPVACVHLQPVGPAVELYAHQGSGSLRAGLGEAVLEGLPPMRQVLLAEPTTQLLQASTGAADTNASAHTPCCC